ncbi:PREDICTED: melanoma-associated antigen B3-like [Elephantulus edwardii]|uniref:melanoma-associated antigen B3-like n=1 Tax=Elephantulus edwardii TaxID=28737 RepID=UPI0003F0AF77|nr:PREDICTED: melanoma-associated antigen B3-like [Elephantulus edwardii]
MTHNQNDDLIENLSEAQSGIQESQVLLKDEGELPSSSVPLGNTSQCTQSPPAAGPDCTSKDPITTLDIVCVRPDESTNNQTVEESTISKPSTSKKRLRAHSLAKKAGLLEQFLLHKYKMQNPITLEAMLKVVNEKYKDQFPEILRRASEHIEIVFAVDVKEIDPITHSYALVSKMDLPHNGKVYRGKGFPKTGLLMGILGVILLKGNRATEKDIWAFLNTMRIFDGKKHFIYKDPRKLITKEFVTLKYLEYQQVPNSKPSSWEFLWGARAFAETTKLKILEFLAKVNSTEPSAFGSVYEEALREEEERARAVYEPVAGCSNEASSQAMASCSDINVPL